MSDKLQITIVGLGLIGASAGLALRRYQEKVTVVGHDRDPLIAAAAKKLGAVNRTDWNLIAAVSNADRVLLALPTGEIRDTLKAIAQDLKPGCLILDTAAVKTPVMAWAAELLPPGVHFVGGHPVVLVDPQDSEAARADLFEHKLFCLTADRTTHDGAVHLAADLVEALGAQPFFLDPVEHDGMAAAVEHLPAVLAGALMAAASRSVSWQDMRKLAGAQFFTSTQVMADTGKEAAAGLIANRESLLRWLEALIAELGAWQAELEAGREEELAAWLEDGLRTGRRWTAAYQGGVWDEAEAAEIPTAGKSMRELFLGRMRMPGQRPKHK